MKKHREKTRGAWKKWLFPLVFACIGAVCGLLIARSIDRYLPDGLGPAQFLLFYALLLLGLFLVLFLQTILHEAGHLVFGLATGYRFSSFRVASFMVIRLDGTLRLKRLSLAGTGGQCLLEPPELVDGKMPFVLYNLGGSMLNLLSALVCLGLYGLTRSLSWLPLFFLMGALIGAVFALMNGIPLRLGAVDNDGYNAWSMSRNPQALGAFWVQMKANALTAQGVRLKDMPADWFQVPDEAGMKNSMIAVQGVFACNRLMDSHQFPEARDLIQRMLAMDSAIVGVHRSLLRCDLLTCQLLLGASKEELAPMRTREQEKFMKTMKNFPAVLRTEYIWALLAEQDEARAGQIKAHFDAVGRTYPYPSDWAGEQELMELAGGKARQEELV